MAICDLPAKELKIAVLRKLTELQENTKRQNQENRINKQNEKSTKETEVIRKNQREILELKNE